MPVQLFRCAGAFARLPLRAACALPAADTHVSVRAASRLGLCPPHVSVGHVELSAGP